MLRKPSLSILDSVNDFEQCLSPCNFIKKMMTNETHGNFFCSYLYFANTLVIEYSIHIYMLQLPEFFFDSNDLELLAGLNFIKNF